MKKEELIFATGNVHKVEAVSRMVKDLAYEVIPMVEKGIFEDIPETGVTMAENATLKSDYLYNRLGLSCFGEDSGLEVEALNMAPGIYTARYAGDHRDDQDNMDKLLFEMLDFSNRKARFRAVISLNLRGTTHLFEGIVDGEIALDKKGDQGFGYDPIFIPEGYDKTFAELGPAIKTTMSHRAKAVQKMCKFLKKQ